MGVLVGAAWPGVSQTFLGRTPGCPAGDRPRPACSPSPARARAAGVFSQLGSVVLPDAGDSWRGLTGVLKTQVQIGHRMINLRSYPFLLFCGCTISPVSLMVKVLRVSVV